MPLHTTLGYALLAFMVVVDLVDKAHNLNSKKEQEEIYIAVGLLALAVFLIVI